MGKIKEKLNSILSYYWHLGSKFKKSENILITGSPRGGTTWILELIETLPNCRRMWEPFSKFPLGDLNRRPYLDYNEDNDLLKKFLEDIFSGKKLIKPRLSKLTYPQLLWLYKVFAADKTIFKFCRAQRLLPWLSKNYDYKKILIMRHPLATVASQLNHSGFKDDTDHPIISDYDLGISELDCYIEGIKKFEKKLTVSWCYDYLIPLLEWNKINNTLLITYERMVTEPRKEISRIENFLDYKFPQKIYEKIDVPSQTTKKDSNVIKEDKDPLKTWKKRLNDEEINNILEVLNKFGIDFYDESLLPNYEVIRSKYNINI